MANKTRADIYGYAQDLLKFEGEDVGLAGLEEDRTVQWVADLDKQLHEDIYAEQVTLPDYRRVIWQPTDSDLATLTGALADETFYTLPADFGRMRPSRKERRDDGVQVDGDGYLEVPEFPTGNTFAVHTDGTDTYLWVPDESDAITVFYDRAPNTITGTDDEISFPDPHHWYHVWGLVALFRQVLDEDYVPEKERAEMRKVVTQIVTKRSAGKRLSAGSRFFGRTRL